MKKTLLFLSFALALIAPTAVEAQIHHNCGTDHMRRNMLRRNPSLLADEAAYEARIQEMIRNGEGLRSGELITIPIVFHIVHNYGPENISDEQIFNQVEILNRDFTATNTDLDEVVDPFQSIIGDAQIQFRLATIDPDGNCTDGIDRIASVETYSGDDFSKLNPWPREKYLNVWVVSRMRDGVAGYAYYPSGVSSPFQANIDGIIILHDYIGDIGTGTPGRSRALTHEIGHYLNLAHPWGNTNEPDVECGDDGVEDTPETEGWTFCNLAGSECNPGVIENVQNYMDYSYCSLMFTQGQVDRMRAALALELASRNNLYSPENLAATGTDGITTQVCAPEADFYPERPMVCTNDGIRFFDNSVHGQATSWSWTFEGGSPATSTQQNPIVEFATMGYKTVTLTVTNAEGSSTKTQQYAIYVSDDDFSEIPGPISEGFENQDQAYLQFQRRNLDNNSTYWDFTNTVGLSGNGSAVLNAYDFENSLIYVQDADRDELITPSMNLELVIDGVFNFAYAYATQAANVNELTERLEVSTSTNCGETWITRLTLEGADLVTAGNNSNSFVPNSVNDWRIGSFNIPGALETNNVLVKFTYFSSSYSNNLYIDNINISGVVNVDELGQENSSVIYPNPSNGQFFIGLLPGAEEKVDVAIYDASGRLVHQQQVMRSASSKQRFELNLQHLSDGMYTSRISSGTTTEVSSLLISK